MATTDKPLEVRPLVEAVLEKNVLSSKQEITSFHLYENFNRDVQQRAEMVARPALSERELLALKRKAESALDGAATNRGRETNAFKAVHDLLSAVLQAGDATEDFKLRCYSDIMRGITRVRDWDKIQWFKKDATQGTSEIEFIRARNGLNAEQMLAWDTWAIDATRAFNECGADIDAKLANLDNYLVRRVSVDSVKNWLRRRPDQEFINTLFESLASNKLYIDAASLRIRCVADETGAPRAVELRDGILFYEGTEDRVPLQKDERGEFVMLPDDSDMIIFEKRTISGARRIVPMAQPNDHAPNIQWFGGDKVKAGWAKEQQFFKGPDAFSVEDLYGFFPDHFPMRVTNSMETGKTTEKTGAAIYGYSRDHAGRQSRQLIAEYGVVMDNLKRNNSQLINETRSIFGIKKPSDKTDAGLAPGGKNRE